METKILAISTNRRPREGAIIQRNFRATSYSITLGRHLAINCRALDRPLHTSIVVEELPQRLYNVHLERDTFIGMLTGDVPDIKQG